MKSNIRKIIHWLTVYLFIMSFAGCAKRENVALETEPLIKPTDKLQIEPPAESAEPLNPLTIEGARRAVFTPAPLIEERIIHNEAAFISHEISFMVDNLKEYALISTPKRTPDERGYPVILLLHGYIPPTQYSTVNSYPLVFVRYARSEFVVVKPDYRGHDRSEVNDDFQREISTLYYTRDVRQLIASLSTRDNIDTDRIFLMGHSLGGEVALRLLVSWPGIVGASLWGPMTVRREEANFFFSGRGKRTYGDRALSHSEAAAGLRAAGVQLDSALRNVGITNRDAIRFDTHLADIKSRMIIRHPDGDESVPYHWSLEFKELYDSSGNSLPLEVVNYPGHDHNFRHIQAKVQAEDLAWFRSLLNGQNE